MSADRLPDPSDLACFGWSTRAWATPWMAWWNGQAETRFGQALEVGAGARSSLTPLMLHVSDRVECSYFDASQLASIQQRHREVLDGAALERVRYALRDIRSLNGRWDLIVMKSVVGGVFRLDGSDATELRAFIGRLVNEHLNIGGWLISLENGRTALEPLWSRSGARRNGWRFLRRVDFPPPDAFHSFGLLSGFSAATRLGALGSKVDDILYAVDRVVTPWARDHAVLLHAYQRKA